MLVWDVSRGVIIVILSLVCGHEIKLLLSLCLPVFIGAACVVPRSSTLRVLVVLFAPSALIGKVGCTLGMGPIRSQPLLMPVAITMVTIELLRGSFVWVTGLVERGKTTILISIVRPFFPPLDGKLSIAHLRVGGFNCKESRMLDEKA